MTLKELIKSNKLTEDIWKRKYNRENLSYEKWLERVSNGNKNVADAIHNLRFSFCGRIFANSNLN